LPNVFVTSIGEYWEGIAMKIHMRPLPPIPLAPPPKPPPTSFQLEMQAEDLGMTAQQQQGRLKTLFGAGRIRRDSDEKTESDERAEGYRSNRNLDFLA
jgi:hypothetical protein